MEKTFLEKLGDALDHIGKRFLICTGIAVVGFLLAALGAVFPPVIVIGAPLAYFGVFGMISVFPKWKTYIVGGISIPTPDGKVIPCAILKRKHYAYMPIISIVSPFFYIPYKTQYYLIKNITAPKVEKPLRVSNHILGMGILDADAITVGKYKAMVERPEDFYGEVFEKIGKAREKFCRDLAPFTETGLFDEIYFTDQLSVCRESMGSYVLFHYADDSGYQRGVVISEEIFDLVREDTSKLLEAYIHSREIAGRVIELNEVTLERLLKAPEYKKSVDAEAADKAMDDVDSKKTVITRERVLADLKGECISKRIFWGIFFLFWCVLLAVSGILGGIITIILFSVIGAGFTGYLGVSNLIEGIQYKKKLTLGKFRVVKAHCISIEDKSDDEGNYFVCEFANGEHIGAAAPVCIQGDSFYFVYPEGEKMSKKYYNALEFVPAPEIAAENIAPSSK